MASTLRKPPTEYLLLPYYQGEKGIKRKKTGSEENASMRVEKQNKAGNQTVNGQRAVKRDIHELRATWVSATRPRSGHGKVPLRSSCGYPFSGPFSGPLLDACTSKPAAAASHSSPLYSPYSRRIDIPSFRWLPLRWLPLHCAFLAASPLEPPLSPTRSHSGHPVQFERNFRGI